MMMVILDNDLANMIQAERRWDGTRERLLNESVITARGPQQRFSLGHNGTAWLRVQTAGRLPVFNAFRRRDPSSLESL
jgi:hypothetical protein